MMYVERLKEASKKFQSIVCMGMDPVLEDIPIKDKAGIAIYAFYESILNEMISNKIFPAAVKPNYAFYAQYGFEGLEALYNLIKLYQNEGFIVILDAKRGDIGKTAEAYAKECFDFFSADAVTLSPYLGFDSIEPFVKKYPHKGVYVLVKTSNASSVEFQDVTVNSEPLFMHVCNKIIEWSYPGMGAVVGATYPEQLDKVAHAFANSNREIPLLIPGIGTQGGDLEKVVRALKLHGNVGIHRINSSSAINYAYKRFEGMHFAKAAIRAMEELNFQINSLIGE